MNAEKKHKAKSEASLHSVRSTKGAGFVDVNTESMDVLQLKILGLRFPEHDPPHCIVKVTFFDQLLLTSIIKPLGLRDRAEKDRVYAVGTMNYDPSDYEKMCLFADTPLIVMIQPLKQYEIDGHVNSPETEVEKKPGDFEKRNQGGSSSQRISSSKPDASLTMTPTLMKNTSCCNVDILPLFLDQDKICVKKRMQPMLSPKVLYRQSWDNLPLLTMSLAVERDEKNAEHHRVLQDANWMKVTVVGAYNMFNEFNDDCLYTAATNIAMYNSEHTNMVTFNEGFSAKRRFNNTCFYPRWESLRLGGENFTKGDDKFDCKLENVSNPENLNLPYYMQSDFKIFSSTWGSFRRSLMLEATQKWFWKHLRKHKWPLEVHYYGEAIGGCSFMGFMDLFPLLYPGVTKLAIAVPLYWFNANSMMKNCNCNILLMPQAQTCPSWPDKIKNKNQETPTRGPSVSEDSGFFPSTGADDNPAFVLVEVEFSHPLVPEIMPKYIPKSQFMQMLEDLEGDKGKNACTGRGQPSQRDWQAVVRAAASALHLVPCQALTNFCSIIRQLSETRARVEILTSVTMEAALYANNNFVVKTYLQSDAMFEEMLMIAHVSMMRIAGDTLIGCEDWQKMEPVLRAARHARQLHDIAHAVELYLQAAVISPSDGDIWRELSTCLKDVHKEWARVCLNKSLTMNIRHPLTLLSKACMVYDERPIEAEPFFTALVTLYPFWPTGYTICQAYCTAIEKFRLADALGESLKVLKEERLNMELPMPRAWEKELGDFWEPTLLLPGMDRFYDAADLLLRLRCIRLAEMCLSLALAHSGETAAYYHLVALCCRLSGDLSNALCLARQGMKIAGQIWSHNNRLIGDAKLIESKLHSLVHRRKVACLSIFYRLYFEKKMRVMLECLKHQQNYLLQNTYLKCLEGECLHEMEDFEGSKAAFEKVTGGSCAHSTLLSLSCWEQTRVRTILVDLLRRQPTAYGWIALADDWLIRAEKGDTSMSTQGLSEEVSGAVICAIVCAEQALKFDRRAGRAWALLAKLVKPKDRRNFCQKMAIECGFKWSEYTTAQDLKQHSQDTICRFIGVPIRECRCEMCEHLHF